MPKIHRHGDSRVCGATTVVQGQSSVYVGNELVAVDGDPNSHGGGALNAGSNSVFVNSKAVVNHTPDTAAADSLCPIPPHCGPDTAGGSDSVFVGD